MSASDAPYLVYALLALPLIGAATWSVYRYGAPLLFDLLDADEMVVAAAHRLATAGHVLLGGAAAVYVAPSAADLHRGSSAAVLSSLGGLLGLLAVLHLGLLALFVWEKAQRTARAFARPDPAWTPTARPVLIPGATPPTVPMPPPVFSAPRSSTAGWAVPCGMPGAGAPEATAADGAPAWTAPAPGGPRLFPPYPPPWCTPLPTTFDVWAPPRR